MLTAPGARHSVADVADSSQFNPFAQTVRWLATHAGFPASRLPDKAELLLLISAAAAEEDAHGSSSAVGGRPTGNRDFNAQMRNYTTMRRRVHVKCDNSAKV